MLYGRVALSEKPEKDIGNQVSLAPDFSPVLVASANL